MTQTMTGTFQDFLIGNEAEGVFPQPVWFNGVGAKEIVGGKARQLKGWWFEEKRAPEDFVAAMKKLENKGKARTITVRHGSDKVEKQYIGLIDPTLYVLTHGTPNRTAILKREDRRLGLVAGTWTEYKKDAKPVPQTERHTFTSVLAVAKELYEVGYIDAETGLPKPIKLFMKKQASSEFYDALLSHFDLVRTAREKLNLENAAFFSLGQVLAPSDEMKTHGEGEKSTDVYVIETKHPEKAQWTEAYIRSLYCGDELFYLLLALVTDQNAAEDPLSAPLGGVAIEWCRQSVQQALDNEAEFTPPNKSLPVIKYGTNDAPLWLRDKEKIAEQKQYGEALRGEEAAAEANAPAETEIIFSALTKQIKWWTRANGELEDEDNADELKSRVRTALKRLKDTERELKAELATPADARKVIEEVADERAEVAPLIEAL